MKHLDQNINSFIISPLFLLLLIAGMMAVVTFFFLLQFRKTPGVKYWFIGKLLQQFGQLPMHLNLQQPTLRQRSYGQNSPISELFMALFRFSFFHWPSRPNSNT